MIFCNIHSNKNTKKRSSGRFFVQQKTIIVQRAQPQQYLSWFYSLAVNASFLTVATGGRVWGWQDCININNKTTKRKVR